MREVVCQNQRAKETLHEARLHAPWLAVSLEGFGRYDVAPADGLMAIGDAASFIDPFTGSGMLMALQSGELAAHMILAHLGVQDGAPALRELRKNYAAAYRETFAARLRVCSLLRTAAFVPGLAGLAVTVCGASAGLRRRLARATRGTKTEMRSRPNV